MSQSPFKLFLGGNFARFAAGIGKMSDSELADTSNRYSALNTTGAGQYGLMSQLAEKEMKKRQATTASLPTPVVNDIAKSEAGDGVRRSGFAGRRRNFFNRPAVEGAASLATKAEAPTASTDLSGIESRLASIEQKLSGSETAMGSVGPTAPPVIEPSLPSAADELGAQYMPTPFFLKQRNKMGALMFKDQTGDGKITQADVIKARIEGYKK
jgi:hypothetical protein